MAHRVIKLALQGLSSPQELEKGEKPLWKYHYFVFFPWSVIKIQDESEEGAYIEEDVNDDANMNDDEEGDIIVPSIQITADHHN